MNIKITDLAKENIDKMLKASKKEYVKLSPVNRTCCDIVFTVMSADKEEKDKEYNIGNYKILIDKDLDGVYELINIDYTAEGFQMGFNVTTK